MEGLSHLLCRGRKRAARAVVWVDGIFEWAYTGGETLGVQSLASSCKIWVHHLTEDGAVEHIQPSVISQHTAQAHLERFYGPFAWPGLVLAFLYRWV